jgi:PAS domain S-box-containing protein
MPTSRIPSASSLCCLAALLLAIVTAPCSVHAQTPSPTALQDKRVLVLHPLEANVPVSESTDRGIRAALDAGGVGIRNQFLEFLDLARNPALGHREKLVQLMRLRYGHRKVDVIITMYPDGLRFLLNDCGGIFPGVPILALYMPERVDLPKTSQPIIYNSPRPDIAGTFETALNLFPDTKHVYVVGGAHEMDRARQAEARRHLQKWAGRLEARYLTNMPLADILAAVSSAPPKTIVTILSFNHDATGRVMTVIEAAKKVGEASRAPVFGLYDVMLGHGILGGSLVSYEDIGTRAGQVALDLLRGKTVESIGGDLNVPPEPMFDWRELKRWNVSLGSVPPGSRIINREYTLWERYQLWVLAALAALVLQALVIAGLLIQRRERHAAETALQESEERLRMAVDAAALGDWSWDLRQDRVQLSRRLNRWFAGEAGGLLAFKEVLERIHPEDRGRVEGAVQQAIQTGDELEVEYRIPLTDGTERWVAARGRCTYDKAGVPVRLGGVSQDITERKRVEVEAGRMRQELAHISRVTLMGELTASLAHELNQPLTAIASNAHAGERYLAMPMPRLNEVREILADVAADAHRAGEVIHRLRSLLKKDASRFRPLDLGDVIREAVALIRTDAIIRHQPIELALALDLPLVLGDRVQLQQVLLNLVLNGMDAMAARAAGERQLTIQTRPEEHAVRVGVRDQGPGIPPDQLENVFAAFFTTKAEGMGMGLAISRSIVEAHGGRIWAENNPEGGATFCFTLPVQPRG